MPYYFKVFIHATKPLMHAWGRGQGVCPATSAFFSAAEPMLDASDHCCGVLHFYPGSLTIGIITHEICHALMHWARFVGCLPFTDDPEFKKESQLEVSNFDEICAEAMGSLAAQFMINLSHSIPRARFPISDELLYFGQ